MFESYKKFAHSFLTSFFEQRCRKCFKKSSMDHIPKRPRVQASRAAGSRRYTHTLIHNHARTHARTTPSHACSAGQNSVADLLLASDPALLVSAPALALVAGATKLSKMAAQCFLFHLIVLFMPHSKTLINTTDTSSPPSLSVGSLACLWHAGFWHQTNHSLGTGYKSGPCEKGLERASSFPNNTPLISYLPL